MRPSIVTLSSLYPSSTQPGAGLFVRERASRLAARLPLTVVSPVAWSPVDGLVRLRRPSFRPQPPTRERQGSIEVHHPRFLSLPGLMKRLDGSSMARAVLPVLRRLQAAGALDVLDAHFGYPDGLAACRAARRLGVPFTVTLRGTETRHARDPVLAPLLGEALCAAERVICVSDSLRQVALGLGVPSSRATVVGNGVDLQRFLPLDRATQRRELGLPEAAPVLISVGGLCERKGFHRVMACLPALRRRHPGLRLLVVGGPSPEGDWSERLRQLAVDLGILDAVIFTGPQAPDELRRWLSAADVFVLATRNEGWANVFLEAMACGLPVVTTHVGGNAEVVCDPGLGSIVPFDDPAALQAGIDDALQRPWDHAAIRAHAEANTWSRRIDELERIFCEIASRSPSPAPADRTIPAQP